MRISGELQLAFVGGRDAYVDHLHGGKFLQRTARGEPRCERPELPAERDVQAVREEGDEHMRFDTVRFEGQACCEQIVNRARSIS